MAEPWVIADKSISLRTHCQTSGWSLTAQDPFNNVARTCLEAMAAVHGHTQSLHTNSLDEALALPSEFAARIDAGSQVIVGLNRFRVDEEAKLDLRQVDKSAVRAAQIRRLEELRAKRDAEEIRRRLDVPTHAAERGDGNLMELTVEAARAKAMVGEMAEVLAKVYGRHQAAPRLVHDVYGSEVGVDRDQIKDVRALAERFEAIEGPRPRLLVAKRGQDGHDRGQKVVATAFADLGFDVDVGPLFQTPEETARQAVENDVHVVGASSLAAGHLTLIPALRRELDALGRPDILVVAGGVIPPTDHEALYAAGAVAIFGPGTVILEAARVLLADREALFEPPGVEPVGQPGPQGCGQDRHASDARQRRQADVAQRRSRHALRPQTTQRVAQAAGDRDEQPRGRG